MESTEKIHNENSILTIKQHAHHSLTNHIHSMINENIRSITTIKFNNEFHQYNTRKANDIRADRVKTVKFGNKQSVQKAIQLYNKLPAEMKSLNKE